MQTKTVTCTLKDTTVIDVVAFSSLFTKWNNTGMYICPNNGYSDIIFYARLMQTKTMAEFKSFVMNNKAFGNLFFNSQKSFHTSPGSSDSNNRGYWSYFKLNNGICIYKKS